MQRQALRAEAKLKEKEQIKAKAWEVIRIAPRFTMTKNRKQLTQLATDYLRAAPKAQRNGRFSKRARAIFYNEFNR